METCCAGIVGCYSVIVEPSLVVETVFNFHSNGRGFFPTLVSCGE